VAEQQAVAAREEMEAAEAAVKEAEDIAEELRKRKAEEQATIDASMSDAEKAGAKMLCSDEETAYRARSNTAAAKPMSIAERVAMLNNAEARWLESYKESMVEWNERNQFEAEEYDLTFSLTPIQSRLEALRQKGVFS
jgi:hypothetical protein